MESLQLLLSAERIALLSGLGVFFLLFLLELLSVDLVAVLIILFLVLTDILPIGAALQGFGHPAVIGIGALFVVSEGLLRTGALGIVANQLERWSKGSERRLIIFILLIVATSSAFLNNTPVVAMFIPVVLGLSRRLGINPSHLLIPLSYAAILGGTCTLIGTSTNILVSSLLEENGLRPLGLFEFTPLGLLFAAIGLVYLIFVGPRLLPDRQTITSMTSSSDRRLREYVTELEIVPQGDLDRQRFGDSLLAHSEGVRVIQLIRGEEIVWPPFDDHQLTAGDAVIIAGKIEDLMQLQAQDGLASLQEIIETDEVKAESRETELAELLVLPNSTYVGKTLEGAQIRSQFGVSVIAIQRHGMHLRRKISDHPLRVGDVLLVQGIPKELERVGAAEGLVLMSGIDDIVVRKSKAPVAALIMMGLLLLLSMSNLNMATVALAAALLMILTRCLPEGRIYDAVHWRVLVLIAGTLALGHALQTTGTAALLAAELQQLFGFAGPRGLVVVTLILSALLTECISNTAVAAVMIPIALAIPQQFPTTHEGAYLPFVMAVAYGASCSFLTPIGYQTNTLVYGAGGYRFSDFPRIGLPLVLIIWALGGWLIPEIWPV